MKKVIVLILILLLTFPAFADEWIEIFEKQYLHLTTIEPNYKNNTVKFWVKSLRKDPKETFPNFEGKAMPYWYSMNQWNMDCNNKKERIEVVAVYDLKGGLLYSDEYIPDWNTIIPDTYADGFYRLFCIVPFEVNPLLNGDNK